MRDCKEYTTDELVTIIAIPLANISASDVASPVNTLAPTISEALFSPSLDGAIVIGTQPVSSSYQNLIPIKKTTGEVKDSMSDSVAGVIHNVNVSCQIDYRDSSVWNRLLLLQREPHHLLLRFRGGDQAFVSATRDTYKCDVERESEKTSVSFTLHNLYGMQLIV